MFYVVMRYDGFCCWCFLVLIWRMVWLEVSFTFDEVFSFCGFEFYGYLGIL